GEMPDRVHAPSIRVEADRPAGDLDRSLGLTRPVEVDRQRTAVDLHRHEPRSRAEGDVVAPGAGIERDRGDVDMSHVDGSRRRAAVEADRPRHARVELDVCLEMRRPEDDELEADHDQADRPQVDELVAAIDRYLPGVDEQRDDASEDEDRGPEEAAVAVRVAHYRALMFTRSAPPEMVTS